jgi:hypothetical protein
MLRLRISVVCLLGLMLGAAAAVAQPVSPYDASGAVPLGEAPDEITPLPPPRREPSLTPAQVAEEVARLRAELRQSVGQEWRRSPRRDRLWVYRAWEALRATDRRIDRPQLIVVVDRNPRVQEVALLMAQPNGPWAVIGGTKVSTGQPGRFDHFITPLGVFPHTDAILDYRAEGTFNENHIRGLGLKGMRVWDFGWQVAKKGWRDEYGQMRLLMHATDPANLAHRIGRPASKGCIRVPAAMNRFMDRYGVLDFDYERSAEVDPGYRALLPPNRRPTPLAGDLLVVIDSSLPAEQAVAAARPHSTAAAWQDESDAR